MEVALLQTRPRATMAEAAREAAPLAREAASDGATFLLLPEYCGGLATDGGRLVPPSAPEPAHEALRAFRDLAADLSVHLLVGSVAVDGPMGRIRNRGHLVRPDGALCAPYDKIHLFDVDLSEAETFRESDVVESGARAVIHEVGVARVGHTICYDLRFPALYRALAQGGAEVLTCPAAFTRTTGEAHWHVLNRARAIECGAWMLSPCAAGPIPGGGESYGHSLIVNPWGEVVADGGDRPGIVRSRIDLAEVSEARRRIPSLSHDRAFDFAETRGAA